MEVAAEVEEVAAAEVEVEVVAAEEVDCCHLALPGKSGLPDRLRQHRPSKR